MKTLRSKLDLPRPVETPGHSFVLSVMLASRTLSGAARGFLKGSGLTEAQLNILMMLRWQFDDGASQTELSRRMLVNRANVTGLIDRLERDGFVRREPDAGDRRKHKVVITGKGTRKLDSAAGPYFEGIHEIARHISEKDRQRVESTLLNLCELMEKVGEEDVWCECSNGKKREGRMR